ncbi:MAG: hypothetical protein JXA33_04650 [Anaerolineae bacterium]|nr:hypothetical protein [Anaerolineae bacterium]
MQVERITDEGIQSDILRKLHNILLNCQEFNSNELLSSVFLDSKIIQWRDSLPEASDKNERVQLVTDYLYREYTSSGENALILFLEVIRNKTNP